MYQSFRPGKFWYDTNAEPIQAHGGSILFDGEKFWWYGENKHKITGTATGERCPFPFRLSIAAAALSVLPASRSVITARPLSRDHISL